MENKVDNGESGRRRFIRRLTTLGAAGGIATLLYGRVTEKPLIQLAQAASGGALIINAVNDGEAGTTELDSTIATGPVLKVLATATSAGPGSGPTALYGETEVPGGSWPDGPFPNGVEGYASAESGLTTGMYGHVDSPDGVGVGGVAYSKGVFGIATATSGAGVGEGMSPAGVHGETSAAGGLPHPGNGPWPHGVEGFAYGASGSTNGVYGEASSPDGSGIWGSNTATSGFACGVGGWSSSPWGTGLFGWQAATTGSATGVLGRSDSTNGIGVCGKATAGSSSVGMIPKGVLGQADSIGGSRNAGPWPVGVEGYATGASGATLGVWGHSDSPDGVGVSGQGYSRQEGASSIGVLGGTWSPDGIGVFGLAYNASAVPLVARGNLDTQTANLQEWQKNDGTPLSVVNKDGSLGIGTASPARQLHIVGSNAVARLDRDVDSASFIFTRTAAGNFNNIWKTFTFGVKATGVDSGSFFIGDMHTNVSGSSDNRILIDTNGNVGIGTTAPTSKLHVNGRVKAKGYDTGDITFANGYRLTEDPDSGMLLVNEDGEGIARFDHDGNLHIKGKLIEDL